MSLGRTIARGIETGIKLPFALVVDVATLGNCGSWGDSFTERLVNDHRNRKQLDDVKDVLELLK